MAAEIGCEMLSKVGQNGYVVEVEEELKGAFTHALSIYSLSNL